MRVINDMRRNDLHFFYINCNPQLMTTEIKPPLSVPLPPQISYGQFKPKGYYTQFKQWPISPMSSNQYWTPDEIIRFLVTIKSGVMDPYRSHIQMLVSVPLESCPVGGLQVDSSAQSFIAQTVISSNNVELERITEYDTLACYLTDIGFSQYVCESRGIEGLGYSNHQSHTPWSNYTGSGQSQMLTNQWPNPSGQGAIASFMLENVASNLVMPCRVPGFSGRGDTILLNNNTGQQCSIQVSGQTTVAPSMANTLWQSSGPVYPASAVLKTLGRFNNVRQQYVSGLLSHNYPDTNTSLLQTCPSVINQTYNINNFLQNSPQSGYNPKNPYQITIPANNLVSLPANDQVNNNVYIPNTCNLYGYQKPISGQFSRGTHQAMLSPTIPQCQMQNGQLLPMKVPISSQLFRLPLLSAICGILIPPEQFLLIPIQALYNLLLQITLSRYAMFTTGYCDVHEFDSYGMSFMQQRKWVISQIVWNLHLYTFQSSVVNQQIEASLVKSIPISATSYSLASQFQLPNGQVVRNSWPVGTQAQSLCQVICIFLSNQSQQYTFCRKQNRLSNNISSMQIKYNTEFFPSQPITGNAGNPCILDTTGDCWPFYEQILLSTNYLFNTNMPVPKINTKNFAINGRCYNVANTAPYYDPIIYNNPLYQWTSSTVNADTAMGMANFHQNRYVGKAAFVYSWQPYGHSKSYMNGLNAQGIQNFSVIFNTTGKNPFPTDQTLLIFTRQNILVVYQANGIKVIGK